MLGRKSLLILVTNTIGAIAGLAMLFVIGRYMGPVAYGMFAFSLSLASLGAFVARLGFDNAHTKRVSEGEDLAGCIGTYVRIKTVLIAAFVLLTASAVLLWWRFQGFTDATTLPVVFATLLYAVFLEIRTVPATTFDALRQTARTQLLNIVEHAVKTPLIIVVALLFGVLNGRWVPFREGVLSLADTVGLEGPWPSEVGAVLIASANAVAVGVSAFVGFALFRYHRFPVGRYEPERARAYASFALPIALTSSLHLIATHLDAFMIGYFWSARDVGYYYAALRITTIIIIVPVAVRTLFFPLISELSRAGDKVGVHTVARSTQRVLSLAMVLATMFLLSFAEEGIHVFLSDSFLPGAPVLRILAVYTLLVSFTTVASSLILGHDRPKTVMAIGVTSVLVNMSLNVLFIPESILGIPLLGLRAPGAALATLLSQVVALVLLLWTSARVTGSTHLDWAPVKHIVSAVATAGVLHLMQDTFILGGLDRFYEIGIAAVVGTLLYLAILIVMREVTRKDLLLLSDIMHPVKMVRYMKDEIRERDREQR